MVMTECVDCDRQAVWFHGVNAYCKRCYGAAAVADPKLHCCVRCGKPQPLDVLWERKSPCAACKESR